MSLKNGRFRTNYKDIEPCCEQMKIIRDLKELKKIYPCMDGTVKVQYWVRCYHCKEWTWINDISHCPFCGTALEYAKKVKK